MTHTQRPNALKAKINPRSHSKRTIESHQTDTVLFIAPSFFGPIKPHY